MADSTNFTGLTQRAGQKLAATVRAVGQIPRDATGTPNPWNTVGKSNFYFPVKVTIDGGVAGSMATGTSCTFTYSLFDLQGNALNDSGGSPITGKTPDAPRFANCQYDAPPAKSIGVAYRDENGDVQLLWAVKEKPTGATINVVSAVGLDGSGNLTQTATPILVLDKGNAGTPAIVVNHC